MSDNSHKVDAKYTRSVEADAIAAKLCDIARKAVSGITEANNEREAFDHAIRFHSNAYTEEFENLVKTTGDLNIAYNYMSLAARQDPGSAPAKLTRLQKMAADALAFDASFRLQEDNPERKPFSDVSSAADRAKATAMMDWNPGEPFNDGKGR